MRKTLPRYYLVEVNTCRCASFYQYMYTYFEALSDELGNYCNLTAAHVTTTFSLVHSALQIHLNVKWGIKQI